jgi:ABC-type multidrug transport system fused ATPase/permease subunit
MTTPIDEIKSLDTKSLDIFWTKDPSILFDRSKMVMPTEGMTMNEKLNTLSRVIILLTIIGFIFIQTYTVVVSGAITLIVICILQLFYQRRSHPTSREGFSEETFYKNNRVNYQQPTINNPAMNVLLTEINDHPERNQAAPLYLSEVEQKMNDSVKSLVATSSFNDKTIDQKLFKDLGDSWGFEQSMRQFYANPITTIPNDQESYAKFLYGDMPSCKEGNDFACVRNNPTFPYIV